MSDNEDDRSPASRMDKPKSGKTLRAANDNLSVYTDLPDSLPVTEAELNILEIFLADIMSNMVPANDNNS